MREINYELGNRIRSIRKERNMSQIECADKLGISTAHLSDIENGKSSFSIEIFIRITELFQVSADWLLQTETPEVLKVYSNEIDNLLADCTPAEAKALLHSMQDMKNIILSHRP